MSDSAVLSFEADGLRCAVAVYRNATGFVLRFYDAARHPPAAPLKNLVLVDPGHGYLCLTQVGDDAVLSGLLDETVFGTDALVAQALAFAERQWSGAANAYLPHHVSRVRLTTYVEYNGEY